MPSGWKEMLHNTIRECFQISLLILSKFKRTDELLLHLKSSENPWLHFGGDPYYIEVNEKIGMKCVRPIYIMLRLKLSIFPKSNIFIVSSLLLFIYTLHINLYLYIHKSMLNFYTPWKHQKKIWFSDVLKGHRNGTLA